jgi:Flp pilus assembly CpaE family ATPase
MGAAAVAGRLTLGRRPRRAAVREAPEDLAFHTPGGPLVAVCGLVGGAGASTLAYLLARRAARHSSAPVLLAELGQQGGLAALAGTAGPLGLRELARAVEEEREPGRAFAELPGGLRLVASGRPAVDAASSTAGLGRLLADAREAHGLVVVDAGQPAAPGINTLLGAAGHLLFALPASVPALRRAELLAAGGIFRRAAGTVTTLVAVATRPGRPDQIRPLRRLAERHVDRLLLVPHLPELAAGQHDQADARLEDTFAALATLLRRLR